MGGGSHPPTPESAQSVTDKQAAQNLTAASGQQAASNVDQSNIFGNLNYSQTGTGPGGVPLYTATQTLSPEMQAIVHSLQGGIQGQLNNSGFDQGNAASTIGNMTSGTTKDLLDKEVSYLQPFFTQQQEQLDSQLRNQGIGPESPAYTRAMNNLGQTQNQSVTGFLAQAEPSAYGQAVSSYMLPLGISQQLQGMLNPNFLPSSFINPPQNTLQPASYTTANANYNQAVNQQYQNEVARQTSMMSGLFGMGSAGLGGWARGGFAGLGGLGGAAADSGAAAAAGMGDAAGMGALLAELGPLAMV